MNQLDISAVARGGVWQKGSDPYRNGIRLNGRSEETRTKRPGVGLGRETLRADRGGERDDVNAGLADHVKRRAAPLIVRSLMVKFGDNWLCGKQCANQGGA